MKSYEKLDLIMNITNTQNNLLGKALSFDASYVSRIRNGKRNIPNNMPFLHSAAEILNQRITKKQQISALEDIICRGNKWPEDKETACELLYQWLLQENGDEKSKVPEALAALSLTATPEFKATRESGKTEGESTQSTQYFFGNSGKRQAVLQFLSRLAASKEPHTLLLYSDEEFNWMYEDESFAPKWAMLMLEIAKNGGKIKIVHTISRSSGEMLTALQKWIPLYMSGTIESYYYPKLLDRVFRRSLFIAKGDSAITATSIEQNTASALNCLVYDKEAVKGLESEYYNFLSLCKPLMQMYNKSNCDTFWKFYDRFEKEEENFLTLQGFPSQFTMSADVISQISKRCNNHIFETRHKTSLENFTKVMEKGIHYTEVVKLPDPKLVKAGAVPLPFSDLTFNDHLCYTAEEYVKHMESILFYLKKYENYHLLILKELPINSAIYVKEYTGVIVANAAESSSLFTIAEPRMTAALWEYVEHLVEHAKSKEKTIQKLEEYIEQIL